MIFTCDVDDSQPFQDDMCFMHKHMNMLLQGRKESPGVCYCENIYETYRRLLKHTSENHSQIFLFFQLLDIILIFDTGQIDPRPNGSRASPESLTYYMVEPWVDFT